MLSTVIQPPKSQGQQAIYHYKDSHWLFTEMLVFTLENVFFAALNNGQSIKKLVHEFCGGRVEGYAGGGDG